MILIEDMDMPKGCNTCRFCTFSGFCTVISDYVYFNEKRAEGCKLKTGLELVNGNITVVNPKWYA